MLFGQFVHVFVPDLIPFVEPGAENVRQLRVLSSLYPRHANRETRIARV